MIVLAVASGVLYVTLLIELFRLQSRHAAYEAAWIAERRELLNRIQAPDRLPVRERVEFVVPDREPDEWAKVGTINIDPEYGLDDD